MEQTKRVLFEEMLTHFIPYKTRFHIYVKFSTFKAKRQAQYTHSIINYITFVRRSNPVNVGSIFR